MLIYLVVFLEEYHGWTIVEQSRAFLDLASAKEYCNQLNVQEAKDNHCEIDDLGDYYEVIEMPLNF